MREGLYCYYLDREGKVYTQKEIEHLQFQKEKTFDEIIQYIKDNYVLMPEEYMFVNHKYYSLFIISSFSVMPNNKRMKKILFNILKIERSI
jgi:hypothetical protein